MHTSLPSKIIITGTGRAGTTVLVQILTELGLDTGYTVTTWHRDYYEHCSAGLEREIEDPESPTIIKDPKLCETLPAILKRGTVHIAHAIVPIRALGDAAQSRIRVGGNGRTPGGLTGTPDPHAQRAVLGERFHTLVHTLVSHEIPHTFLLFPRFVTDADYAYRQLKAILPGISAPRFAEAFRRVVRPDLVHDFATLPPADVGAPARAFVRRRLRRRILRVAGSLTAFAAVWALSSLVTRQMTTGLGPAPATVVSSFSETVDPSVASATRSFARTRLAPGLNSAYLADSVRRMPPPGPPLRANLRPSPGTDVFRQIRRALPPNERQ